MTTIRQLFVLAAALPLWIVMILTGGQWCVMPASADALSVVSSVGGIAPSGAADRGGHRHHFPENHRDGEGGRSDVVAGDATADAATADAATADAATADAATADAVTADAVTPPSSHHGSEGTTCTSQAACSAAIAPASLQLTRVPPGTSGRVIAAFEKRPASLTLAPELPPPRA